MKISPKVRPLRYWAQKVLPLVYDDSLSYYEVLGKIAHKINEIITQINERIVVLVDAMYVPENTAIRFYTEEDENE